jgi:hypothetical protein
MSNLGINCTKPSCHLLALPHTANVGPAKILYKCMVPIYVFPEMNLLFPKIIIIFCLSVPSHKNICDKFIYVFPGLVCLFCCRGKCGPILGIYKSLTDTFLARDCKKSPSRDQKAWVFWPYLLFLAGIFWP